MGLLCRLFKFTQSNTNHSGNGSVRRRSMTCPIRSAVRLKRILHLLALGGILWGGMPAAGAEKNDQWQLPPLQPQDAPYHTPLSGEGFHTEVFGREVDVEPWNNRSVSAWDLGVAVYEPPPEDSEYLPIGSLYFWRHPDAGHLLRARVSGVDNDIFWSRSPDSGPFEWVLTFTNYTVPVAQADLVDGKTLDSRELLWGDVRPGFGLGYRRQVAPGHQDNMLAVDLTFEPGYEFFDKGDKTENNYVVPKIPSTCGFTCRCAGTPSSVTSSVCRIADSPPAEILSRDIVLRGRTGG